MSDPGDDHETFRVVDGVHDPVVPHANSIVVAAGQLDCARRARLVGEGVDGGADPVAEGTLEAAIGPRGARMESELVRPLGRYSRTSAHGTAASGSSRACNAARLSSR